MSAKILANENYMDDVLSCVYSGWFQALKRKNERDENSIWGPVEMPSKGERNKVSIWDHFEMPVRGERDEMSIWDPFEIPVRGKSVSTMNQHYPTKMFKKENVNENAIIGMNHTLSSPKEKVIRHDPTGNYSSKAVHERKISNMDSSEIISRIIRTTDKSDEDYIPKNCLLDDINYIAPEAQNVETIKISNHCHQKINIEGSLDSNLSDRSRLLSSVKYKQPHDENINSDDLEMETVSSIFKNETKNIHEDANPGNSSKNFEYDASAKTRTEFDNWCENRRLKYKSSPNPAQVVAPISTVTMTEEQDLSKRKSIVSKSEYGDVTLEPEKQKVLNYSTDRVFVCKTNLSHENDEMPAEQSITDLKQILINAKFKTSEKEETDCFKLYDSKNQNVPEITNACISENNPQLFVKMSNDKKNTASFKKQNYNVNPKTKVAEKILDVPNIKEIICSDKNSGQNESNECKKWYEKRKVRNLKFKQKQTFEIPPRFKNNDEKKTIRPEKMAVSKKVHPGNKFLNEDSETFQKKKRNSDTDIPVSHASAFKDSCLLSKEKTPICIKITDERCNKNFEFMSDTVTLSRKRKIFPKLSADIPDVDCGPKKLHYSADALDIILRYILIF